MRTRLASLIIVKQEPIANDFDVDGENETVSYNNDLANHFYGQNRLENFNGIGDLNNNHSKDEFEDHKSMYIFWLHFFVFYILFRCFIYFIIFMILFN